MGITKVVECMKGKIQLNRKAEHDKIWKFSNHKNCFNF